jgi:anti-anti-sigma factor
MKYSVDKREKLTILRLQDENLNSMLAPDLKSKLIILHNEGVNNLIIDLSEVKYVDSSGLSAILTGNRMWKETGSFILTGIISPTVMKLLEISKLDSVLTIVPTIDESIDYVFMEEMERELNADS